MDERASGIILRTRPLTETSLIVHWLTPELGRITTVAKGARRPKSAFRGKLDLFFLGDFSFQRSRKSELHNLREVVLRKTFSGLRRDLARVQCASYCCALVEQATETETPILEVYELLASALQFLNAQPTTALFVFAFEMKLMNLQGVQPALAESCLSAGSRRILEQLSVAEWDAMGRLRISPAQSGELANFLRHALVQGFERDLPARESLLHELSLEAA